MGDLFRRASIGLGLALILLATSGTGASAPTSAGASAQAFAIRIVGGSATRTISSPPDAVEFGGGFSYPSDGSIMTAGSYTASTSADAGDSAFANASAEISSISLFNGEVTASAVTARARASAQPGSATGDVSGVGVSGLTVNGVAAGGGRVALGDWGYAVVGVQGVAQTAESYRGYVTALSITLTADHGGLPAGSVIQIGYADVSVTAPALPPPPPVVPKPPPPAPKPKPPKEQAKPDLQFERAPSPPARPPEPDDAFGGISPIRSVPPDVSVKLTAGGYVFPVYGPASFTDTYGAFRGDVSGNWHHGQDIFAPLGAPVLAVANGTVFSVGWNRIGGNRLWLMDRQGNQFYYAHLSAFTPLAVNGARVRAGDVLGFVGNSGDAAGTPPHLHFEIHPVSLLHKGYDGVVNPYSFLVAWQKVEDVRFAAAVGWAPTPVSNSNVPKPGAILLQASDISSGTGLDPASLRRAIAPVATEGDGALIAAAIPRPPTANRRLDR